MTQTHIIVRGAREHNLKNISLDIPREKLVVITGLSGSGKSSLAFDTIYAEGQRRYVESLSAYARQFLEMQQKPDVDLIDGLSPAISIEQKTTSKNPRSTVGTVTEIYDYMRLLWARVGVPYSPATGLPIESQTVSQMVDRVLALPEGTRLYLLAPMIRGRKGEYRKELADLQKRGFQRIKLDGVFFEIADAPALDKKLKHDIDVVVDRIVVRDDIGARLADSFETALELADGIAIVEFADAPPPELVAQLTPAAVSADADADLACALDAPREAEEHGDVPSSQNASLDDVSVETAMALAAQTPTKRSKKVAEVPPHPGPLPRGEGAPDANTAPSPLSLGEKAGVRGGTAATPMDNSPELSAKKKKKLVPKGKSGSANGDKPFRITFSQRFACPVSGFTIEEIEPRLFSFNAPVGACPKCAGLGTELKFEAELVIPDQSLSLRKGAVAPWARTGNTSPYYTQTLEAIATHYDVSMETPWSKLPQKVRDVILWGSKSEPIAFTYDDGMRSYTTRKPFEGVITNIERRWKETDSQWVREELSRFQSDAPCQECKGFRLKPQALAVKVGGKHIGEASQLSIRKADAWFGQLSQSLSAKQNEIAARILKEIRERLRFLNDVGLDYLALSRNSGTLSGGESQRIRLASQIGSGLTGVLYVLDEPSIGLHQRDNERLLDTLKHLRDLGNSVLVVEHDEDAILQADYVVDIGPGAGVHGGRVIVSGTPADIMACPESLTGQYLTGAKSVRLPGTRRKIDKRRLLTVRGARGNNLKDVTASVPLGCFTAVTGVSGGGKSTLLIETIQKAAARRLNGGGDAPEPFDALEGIEHLDKVIDIDQSPIGRTPRSNPATYTGAFGPIREWFSGLPEAKARGYLPGRFSFNVKGGRCEACQGDGVIKIEMHFLPDVYVTCDVCKGHRYNRETLEIKFKGKSIADVLEMTVDEAAEFFKAVPAVRDKMETLQRVGLGYIKVGQQATTLSGGEAQRVKLSKELAKRATGKTLYILDEPTTGLHFHDVAKLLDVLHQLVDAGNTVAVIEHNLEVIKTADWVIDLGPEGGDGGGRIVAEGRPEDVAKAKGSYTGRFLAEVMARRPGKAVAQTATPKAAE
jgi:excinuclease ABC subunit A